MHCIQGRFTKQMLQHTNNFFLTLLQLLLAADTNLMCIILCVCHSNHFSASAEQVPSPADYFATSCKTHTIIHPELASLIIAKLSRRLHNLANQKGSMCTAKFLYLAIKSLIDVFFHWESGKISD
jgi:hypothetical protein